MVAEEHFDKIVAKESTVESKRILFFVLLMLSCWAPCKFALAGKPAMRTLSELIDENEVVAIAKLVSNDDQFDAGKSRLVNVHFEVVEFLRGKDRIGKTAKVEAKLEKDQTSAKRFLTAAKASKNDGELRWMQAIAISPAAIKHIRELMNLEKTETNRLACFMRFL